MQKVQVKSKKSAELREIPEKFVIGNYQILKIIGKGSFGIIYEVSLLENAFSSNNKENFALKMEKVSSKEVKSQIIKEISILKKCHNLKGFATLFHQGVFKGNPYMITSLMGINLQLSLKNNSGKFDQENTLRISYQMIDRIASLHQKGFLHRDIKPENFVIGLNQNSKIIYIIDFGLSKKFVEDNHHVPMVLNKGFVGTARYASPNAHKGFEQGRRDDLISIGYLIMYFLKGKLPWQGLVLNGKDKKYENIGKLKEELDYEKFFSGFHPAFLKYMQYVRALKFVEAPDYVFIKEMFQKAFEEISKEKKLGINKNEVEKKNEGKEEEKEDRVFYDKLLEHIIDQTGKTKIAGSFAIKNLKKNELSKTSTMKPNYDGSSCEILEDDEEIMINKTYEFFNPTSFQATNGFF